MLAVNKHKLTLLEYFLNFKGLFAINLGPIYQIASLQISRSQTHYPRVFVDKNTVDRGKMRNEAHRRDSKNVELY